VYRGKARIKELLVRHGGGSLKEVAGLPFGRLNLRMQMQPVVTVAASGKTAHARWREWALLGEYKKSATWGDAIAEDDYVLEGGVWKIAARRYYLSFEAPYQGGWAALKPVNGSWQSQVAKDFPPDAPAPQYAPFPAVFVPPFHYADGNLRAIQSRPPVTFPARPDDALGHLEALADAKELALGRVESVRAIENLQGHLALQQAPLLRDLLGGLRPGLGRKAHPHGPAQRHDSAGPAADCCLSVLPEAAGRAV
jgi:hypothetical protein